ncbi:M28 family peptidase [Stieleria sp. TO1_6]|uniref:M28 family peptidase n=1 Tax=Stieleria tagensis TaxID=2956795 RepID=UPI00209A9116|nr:M28 family peptidase [Stieleria tagensis]MCO8120703.1 M28 family peptidase [Stieleria tagensis]
MPYFRLSAAPALSALLSLLLMLVPWLGAVIAQPPVTVTDSLRDDIQFLASDELRGRSVTDETIVVARDYLADRMRGIGLQMDSVDGQPFQSVKIAIGSEVRSADNNQCRFQLADGNSIDAKLGDGFGPLAIGQEVGSVTGPVVFAGYGITSATHSYDDFQSINAQDSIVMVLRKEPGSSDPDSPFDGVKNTRHAYFATKIANAIEHGAKAVLIVNDPASTRQTVEKEQQRIDQEEDRKQTLAKLLVDLPAEAVKNRAAAEAKIAGIDQLIKAMQADLDSAQRGVLGLSEAGTQTNQTKMIPVASIARDLADKLLRSSGQPGLEQIEKQIDETYQPASRALDQVTATVSVDLKPAATVSDNVIGRLPGKGPLASQVVVIGAHYDHVGMGGYASMAPGTIAVHNGADDNASGTATMLACAGELSKRLSTAPSHRTFLFIGFTGEERGLVGSQTYVENPVLPIENTVAMINLDMVGRLRDNELTIYGTGTADGLDALVESVNRGFGFDLFKVASGYGPSDHQSFYRVGVPVLFFFTGLHNDYHRPSDDFDKIDFGNLTRLTDMVSEVAFQLAVRSQRPSYAETDARVEIRRQMTAFLGIRISVRSGVVQVTEVTEGGPASIAGLQIDDQIQRIGKSTIRTTADVLSWVRNHLPGDEFEILVRRGTNQITLRGKLEKRP